VIYDSGTGNTKKAAYKVAEGVKKVRGVECEVKHVDDVNVQDLLMADGVIIGSPTYYGCMSWKIKRLLDRSVEVHGDLEGKVGGAFTSSGGTASGAETTILSILNTLLIHGMIVQGNPHHQHYGAAVVGPPDENEEKLCVEYGVRIGKLVSKLFAK